MTTPAKPEILQMYEDGTLPERHMWNEWREEVRGALARGYCSKENEHKVLDADLIEAMAIEVENLLDQHTAHLVESLTKKITPTDMLEGWERYWEDIGDGRYVERCMECENEHRILQAIDIIKDKNE